MSKAIIRIKRRPNPTNLPDHIYDSSKKRIGSTFTRSGDVNTGLSIDEIENYMPHVLGISAQDASFFKKAKEWFMNLSIDIPVQGLELDISTDAKGKPVHAMDFIKYKFACVHPYVLLDSNNQVEKQTKRNYVFILEDKERERKEKISAMKREKEAYQEYIKLSSSEKKMAMVLRVFGEFPDNMDKDDMDLALKNLALENPSRFHAVVTDAKLETRAFIEECLTYEVLRREGNSILSGELVLGSSTEESVLFLQDKKNSEELTNLKERLKQFKTKK